MSQIIKLIVSLVIPFGAGAVGSLWTAQSVSTRYLGLRKPALNPPSRVFGPVWTILYFMIGISLYLIIRDGFLTKQKLIAIGVFMVQITLNALWSYLFFSLRNPEFAFILIIFLLISILINMIVFWKINRLAGMMLIPYMIWVGFATYLNYQIYILNR